MIHRSAAIVVAGTVASYGVAWLIGVPLLVPFLNTIAAFPFMVIALSRGSLRSAIGLMLLWALTMAVCATALSYWRPWATDTFFVRGAEYRTEMFEWVLTGVGVESTPSQFIPQHALHAAVFAALAFATGGVLAMPMGAALMNYMGHYVGAIAAASPRPGPMLLLGWHPWSVIRIISFVAIGVVLSAPLWSRVGKFRVDRREARMILIAGGAGLIVDVVMKWLLAPPWQRLLLRTVGW